MDIITIKVGETLPLHLNNAALITGLTAGDFTITSNSSTAAVATSDLSLSIAEIGSTAHYVASVTYPSTGSYYIKFVYSGTTVAEYQIQVELESISFLSSKISGSVSDYVFTVTDSSAVAVPDAIVRLFDSGGTKLLTKTTTNSLGKVTFSLPVGTYQARVSKDGFDFSSINPATITVVASTSLTPVVSEYIPTTVASSSTLVVKGLHFSSTTVAYVNSVLTSISNVSSDGTVLTVALPAGLSSSVSLQIANPDPATPGSYLTSSTTNLLVSS